MNEFIIRSMRISEFNSVARLVYDSVHTLCTNEYTKEELDAWVPPDMSMPLFRRSIARCYAIVALNECGEIIGVMTTEKTGYVNRLYTRPDWAKKGVATALLKNTEAWAKKRRIKKLLLESSKSAEGFYLKNGFVKVGEMTSVKNNLIFTSAKMVKEMEKDG